MDGKSAVAKRSKRPVQPVGSVKSPTAQAVPAAADPSDPKALLVLRFVFLVVALGATAMLVASHFHLLHPPGCGAGGGCDKAADSPFGKVPGMNWPVSFLGFSYYLAMLVALVATRGRVTGAMRHMARLGALVSAFYLFIIILHRNEYLCAYCITSHLANFGFLATVELARTAGGTAAGAAALLSLRSLSAAAIGFIVATAGLAGGEVVAKKQTEARANEAADEIIKKGQQQAQAAQETPKAPTAAQPTGTKPATSGTINGETWEARAKRLNIPVNIEETLSPPQGFTGRWRIGPEDAPIRIVTFSDYQCPDCQRIEDEVREILLTRNDVSFTHKHFPFNMECNPTFKNKRSPHPNACWAARAAETAGILRGNRGFWEMHFWLYDRKDAAGKPIQGSFTDEELRAGVTSLGYDFAEFKKVMESPAAGEWIDDECLEGASLGLMYTPLIYINGVEFRQFYSPGALKRTIERIAASNPKPGLPTLDQPMKAVQKGIEDWRISYMWPPNEIERASFSMAKGPENAPIQIILWGDYEDPRTQEANKAIMERYAGRSDVRLEYRHYPFHENCNMWAEREDHPRACRMAAIAEGAGRLGGPDKFWEMHTWLMEQGEKYDEDAMRKFAESIGLDPVELMKQAESPEVQETITGDCAMLIKKLSGREIPAVMVNWRLCPRWRLTDGTPLLPGIFDAAEKEAGLKKSDGTN